MYNFDPVAPNLTLLISTAPFLLLPQTCTCSQSPHLNLGTTSKSSKSERSGSSLTLTCLTLPWTVLSSQLHLPISQALVHLGHHHLELEVLQQLLSLCPFLGIRWARASDLPTDCPDHVPSQLNLAMPPSGFMTTTWPNFQGTVRSVPSLPLRPHPFLLSPRSSSISHRSNIHAFYTSVSLSKLCAVLGMQSCSTST